MFARKAGGPHPSGSPPVASSPTLEELGIALEAVKAAVGDTGSLDREWAASRMTLGWIDVETALGYFLFDRFVGHHALSSGVRSLGAHTSSAVHHHTVRFLLPFIVLHRNESGVEFDWELACAGRRVLVHCSQVGHRHRRLPC